MRNQDKRAAHKDSEPSTEVNHTASSYQGRQVWSNVKHPNHFLKVCVCVKSLSRVWLFATPWTIAHQAPLSMGFSRQEYWSGLPFPSPGIFPTQGSNPGLLHCRQTLYSLSHQGSQAFKVGTSLRWGLYISKSLTELYSVHSLSLS